MRTFVLAISLLFCGAGAHAQACSGGLYLNPQVIRGEGSTQTESALRELVDFLKPSGLSVTPVINIKDAQEVRTAVAGPTPPCWVYGNPVVGLTSGYKPVAINMDPIQAAVLVLGDIGTEKDAKPKEFKDLPAEQRAKVLQRLKTTSCFGMKSGVTTALVQAEKICGTVVEVVPQQGLGQSYLPTKAAFQWQPGRWVGLITRLQTAQGSTMKNHHGTDERIHLANLIIVPATDPSWGYGLYTHPAAPPDAVRKAAALLLNLQGGSTLLLRALDLGKNYKFDTPSDAVVQSMRKALATN